MSKRTQIAVPYDPNNPNSSPNDLFQDEHGSENTPMTKVFIGKVTAWWFFILSYTYICFLGSYYVKVFILYSS